MKILFKPVDWENCFSSVTTFLGPPLIFLATSLICSGVYLYFNVSRPYNNLNVIADSCLTIFGVFLVIHIFFNYFMAITTNPGTPSVDFECEIKCKKCGVSKPCRAHHCSICRRCILKMDVKFD
jgi:hypothetical protein